MQSLPDIAPERRAEAARRYVARAGAAFAAADQEAFVATTLRLLDEPRFAPLFSPGSRAEVPIVGRIARPGKAPLLVSGQIDRLAVTAAEVLIGDYKTNRPAPRTFAEVPPSLRPAARALPRGADEALPGPAGAGRADLDRCA